MRIPGDRSISDAYPDCAVAVVGISSCLPSYAEHISTGIDRTGEFDLSFFGIPPYAATDLSERVQLSPELSWAALEDAAILPAALKRSEMGIFIEAIGNSIPDRISAALGSHGPSVALSTAEASPLLAVKLACECLQSGEASLALAGSLGADDTQYAGVFVVLKPLSRALTDRDHIYCQITQCEGSTGTPWPASGT
jgi:acyl transferase domain-containing protein